MIAEKQELRDQNTALKRENEALVTEHGEQRIGWMEQLRSVEGKGRGSVE